MSYADFIVSMDTAAEQFQAMKNIKRYFDDVHALMDEGVKVTWIATKAGRIPFPIL